MEGIGQRSPQGLSAGVAVSYGQEEGGLSGYRTPGQATAFSYLAGTIADGARFRYSPQLTYYKGPFGLLGEYVAVSHEVRNGAQSGTLNHEAFQVAASYVLTGEQNSYKGITPKKPFDLSKGQWGAFELSVRYSELKLDDDTFPTYANPAASVKSIQSIGAGLNWYLTRNLKSSLTFENSSFEGGAAGGDRDDENVLFARFQVAF